MTFTLLPKGGGDRSFPKLLIVCIVSDIILIFWKCSFLVNVALFVVSPFGPYDLSIIVLRTSFVIKFVWFAQIYFFFISTCSFRVPRNIFLTVVRFVTPMLILSLLIKNLNHHV